MLTARWNNLFPPRLLTERVTCQQVLRGEQSCLSQGLAGTDNQAERGVLDFICGVAGD